MHLFYEHLEKRLCVFAPFYITTKLFYHIFDSGINVVSSKQYDPLPIEPGALFYQNDFLIHRWKEHTDSSRNRFKRSRKSYDFLPQSAERPPPIGFPLWGIRTA